MFNKVVIGGTYNAIHKGHRKLLDTGFLVGKEVVIGLTSDDFAKRFRVEKVAPYEQRKKNLEGYIKKFGKNYRIEKIEDSYGVATLDPGIDCIVASEETLLRASEINVIRYKKGLEKMTIIVVPLVLADDGKPISGDRIAAGKIDLEGRKLGWKALITLGPTREYLDPVRYITNASSGKMGAALAEEGIRRGHKVTIVAGPVEVTLPDKAKTIHAESAKEMTDAALKELGKGCDVLIAAAAIADYSPEKREKKKIRSGKIRLLLELKPTKKLTSEARKRFPGLYIVGFKAEHGVSQKMLEEIAFLKLKKERLNLIAANDISKNVFGSDHSTVTIIDPKGIKTRLRRQTKKETAKKIWDVIERFLDP